MTRTPSPLVIICALSMLFCPLLGASSGWAEAGTDDTDICGGASGWMPGPVQDGPDLLSSTPQATSIGPPGMDRPVEDGAAALNDHMDMAPQVPRPLPLGEPWWNSSWDYRVNLTFNTSDIMTSFLYVPIYVELTAANFNYPAARPDGLDLRFIDDDHVTVLDHHIETWDPEGSSAIWVNVTRLDGWPLDDWMWLYYGNPDAMDVQNETGTYNDDFAGVWHLGEASGALNDSTSNGNDGTPQTNTTHGASGRMGKAVNMTGVEAYVDCGNGQSLNVSSDATVEAWVKVDSLTGLNMTIINQLSSEKMAGEFALELNGTGHVHSFRRGGGDNVTDWARTDDPIPIGTWVYLAVTFSGGTHVVYVNGVFTPVNQDTVTRPVSGPWTTRIGGGPFDFNGTIDEVRVSTGFQEGTWFKAQYRSMSGNMILSGNETVTPYPEPPTDLTFSSIGGHHLDMTWNASTSNNVTSYDILINSTGSSSTFSFLANTPDTSYNATGLAEETAYHFQVLAVSDTGYLSDALAGNATTLDITPPAAPMGLSCDGIGGYSVALSWQPNAEADLEGYRVFMNGTPAGPGCSFIHVDNVSVPASSLLVDGLASETTYHFKVSAYDEVPLDSPPSNILNVTTLDVTAPAAPKGLVCDGIDGYSVTLSWQPNAEADLEGYRVFMNGTPAGPGCSFRHVENVTVPASSLLVDGLASETTYHFKVSAYDEVPLDSPPSNILNVTTLDVTAPAAPASVWVTNATESTLDVNWTASPDPDVVGYDLYRSTSPSGPFSRVNDQPLAEPGLVDTGLVDATTYHYRVKAMDEVPLESPFSPPGMGTTILGPRPPAVNMTVPDITMDEDTVDNTSIDLLRWFVDPNGDELSFDCTGDVNISVTIGSGNGAVTLTPKADWNGAEVLTFSASDGVHWVNDSVKVTVSAVNDPPGPARIVAPYDGSETEFGTPVTLKGECGDPDLVYGDSLTFTWYSDLSGVLGVGGLVKNVSLQSGSHVITLWVTDGEGDWAADTSQLTVCLPFEFVPDPNIPPEEDDVHIETGTKKEEDPLDPAGKDDEDPGPCWDLDDSDRDGIPDEWELDHDLDPYFAGDAEQDPDRDGRINREEYLLGSDPWVSDRAGTQSGDGDEPGDMTWTEEPLSHDDGRSVLIETKVLLPITVMLIILAVLSGAAVHLFLRRRRRALEHWDEVFSFTDAQLEAYLLYASEQPSPHYVLDLRTTELTAMPLSPTPATLMEQLVPGRRMERGTTDKKPAGPLQEMAERLEVK